MGFSRGAVGRWLLLCMEADEASQLLVHLVMRHLMASGLVVHCVLLLHHKLHTYHHHKGNDNKHSLFFFFLQLCCPTGISRVESLGRSPPPPSQGKPAATVTLPNLQCMLLKKITYLFHNPPNSDIDYRIFSMCMLYLACVCYVSSSSSSSIP